MRFLLSILLLFLAFQKSTSQFDSRELQYGSDLVSGGASYGGDATYDSSADSSGSYDTGTSDNTDYGSTSYSTSDSTTKTDDVSKPTDDTSKGSPINIDKILKAEKLTVSPNAYKP